MKVSDVTPDMLAAHLRKWTRHIKDVTPAERMAEVEERTYFERMINSSPEIKELNHKLAHIALDALDHAGDLHHLSLCTIVESVFMTALTVGLDLADAPVQLLAAPAIATTDTSQMN